MVAAVVAGVAVVDEALQRVAELALDEEVALALEAAPQQGSLASPSLKRPNVSAKRLSARPWLRILRFNLPLRPLQSASWAPRSRLLLTP